MGKEGKEVSACRAALGSRAGYLVAGCWLGSLVGWLFSWLGRAPLVIGCYYSWYVLLFQGTRCVCAFYMVGNDGENFDLVSRVSRG